MPNKSMPNNQEAEQAVIGSMFLTKKALQKSLEMLMPDDFYLDSHSKIFSCIRNIDDQKRPVDLTTVAEELSVSKSYAYKVIRDLNAEMKKLGYLTVNGRVNTNYFYKKLCYRE